jgi:hypothetical protein
MRRQNGVMRKMEASSLLMEEKLGFHSKLWRKSVS